MADSIHAATSASQGQLPPAPAMVSIAEHQEAKNSAFVVARCRGLLDAATIHRMIMRSNPVSERQEKLGAPFDWVVSIDFAKNLTLAEQDLADSDASYLQYYMDSFGPIEIPSRVPDLPLYIADKATCLERFGKK